MVHSVLRTRSRDERLKRDLYARVGVEEYWFVDPDNDTIQVYRREAGALQPGTLAGRTEVLTSPLFPGLSLPLDRVLTYGYYTIDIGVSPGSRFAYWNRFGRRPTQPLYAPSFPHTWWFDAKKDAMIRAGIPIPIESAENAEAPTGKAAQTPTALASQ